MLSPERSVEIQRLLGSDIVMIFDECTPFPATHEDAGQSMELSLRWAERSKRAFEGAADQALFGIVQGGIYPDLRSRSAEALTAIGFHGYAVGGLAVGEGPELMAQTLDHTVPQLPADRPRYLMGVGKPEDLVEAVARGIDMFDCVLPTRSGRNGQAFTWGGTVNLKNARHADDPRPLDAESPCPASSVYSRAYLHHLVKANEILASMLLTWHNLAFYQALMARMRAAIAAGQFADFAASFREDLIKGDIAPL
jgi:queuine tRNA-ribosyltransferase